MGLFFKKKKDEAISTIEKECFSYDFKMHIDDVFIITGRGTIVVGFIETGACRIGEHVTIQTGAGTIDSTITGLEAFRTHLDIAYAGQNVGILLRGVTKDQLSKGDILTILNAGIYS